MTALLVALGAALGGVLRYLVSTAVGRPCAFPWATFAVNVVGSLAIGVLSGWLARCTGNASAVRAFAVVGFCGGFTTFSTFSNETFQMLENGQSVAVLAYALGSVLAGIAAVYLGHLLSR